MPKLSFTLPEEDNTPRRQFRLSKSAKQSRRKAVRKTGTRAHREPPPPVEFTMPRKWRANLKVILPNSLMDLSVRIVSVDTETNGLLYRHGHRAFSVSLCDYFFNSWFTQFEVNPKNRSVTYKDTPEYLYLKSIIEDKTITKVYHNAKFDINMIKRMGIVHAGPLHDTAFQARCYNTDEINYKLKWLCRKYCSLGNSDEKDLKEITKKLRTAAKKYGWMIYREILKAGKKSKETIEPDYWLVQWADYLLEDKEAGEHARRLAETYCRFDTVRTMKLYQFYMPIIEEDENLDSAYKREMKLFHLVGEMEDTGIWTYLDKSKENRARCEENKRIHQLHVEKLSGIPGFNLNSPTQLRKYLFGSKRIGGLGLEPTKLTKAGAAATGHKELAVYGHLPFIQEMQAWKANDKAITLFFDKYINLVNWSDREKGYIMHAEINQCDTKTLRYSMSNPNLQQAANPETSSRGASVIQVRDCFGPRPDYDWWLFDFAGQELRIMGGLAYVADVIQSAKDGRDIPGEIANKAWGGKNNISAQRQVIDSCEFHADHPSTKEVGILWKEIDWEPGKIRKEKPLRLYAEEVLKRYNYNITYLEKKMNKKVCRTRAKNIFYGWSYGAGDEKLAILLLASLEKTKDWVGRLKELYPEIPTAMRAWADLGREQGYIQNAYGRKLTVDPEFAYKATNYKIQSTAADMMKISMLRCWDYLKRQARKHGIDARIILTVHDELIFEIKRGHAYPWLMRGLKLLMEDHEEAVGIPMEVEIAKCSERWDIEEKWDLAA